MTPQLDSAVPLAQLQSPLSLLASSDLSKKNLVIFYHPCLKPSCGSLLTELRVKPNVLPCLTAALPSAPALTLLLPHAAIFCSSNMSSYFPPQGLCSCSSFCRECPFPGLHITESFLSFRTPFKCHLLRKAFHDHPIKSSLPSHKLLYFLQSAFHSLKILYRFVSVFCSPLLESKLHEMMELGLIVGNWDSLYLEQYLLLNGCSLNNI